MIAVIVLGLLIGILAISQILTVKIIMNMEYQRELNDDRSLTIERRLLEMKNKINEALELDTIRMNALEASIVTCEECGYAVLKEDAIQGKSVIENYKEHELTMPEEKIRKVWYCKEHAPMK